jgi:tetratricopeptide (TPR) repeat protein
VREGFFRANDAVHRDLAMQLADLLEQRGAYAQARIVLGEAIDNTPADARLLMRLGQLHERAGRHNEAERPIGVCCNLNRLSMPARLALAPILEAQNRLPAAIDLLEKFSGVEVDPMLVQLYLKDGRLDDAFATLERISPPNHVAVRPPARKRACGTRQRAGSEERPAAGDDPQRGVCARAFRCKRG